MIRRSQTRTKKLVRMLAIVACTSWGVVVAFGIVDYLRVSNGGNTPQPDVLTSVSDEPSEQKPVIKDDEYVVPADQPRVVAVSKLGINAYIQRVGVDTLGAIATPNNIHIAGWYVNSKSPGEQGVSIIDGHVGGRYRAGVFERIHELAAGDSITVQFDDMSWKEFAVSDVAEYAKEETARPLFAPAEGKVLRLITCGGNYDKNARTYSHRTIVTAMMQ